MGLKLAIVVFSFQLGRISVFRAYTNLLVACIRFGEPCIRLDMDKVYSMKRNISHILKTPDHPRVRYYQCGDFDVLDSILSRPKRHPDSNLKEHFEEENELQLPRITGDIVIMKDK